MSGMVGILNFNGAPVDRKILVRMLALPTIQGPDAQNIWIDGNVALGHALLKTTYESEREQQPFSIDGNVWIVADARVDARSHLIAKLNSCGEHTDYDAPDVELLLRAYRIWGKDCIDHLLGDFAFAIWDSVRRSLFCARDHLGVKPFFYCYSGTSLIFASSLDCIRQHPAISDKLNDAMIGDFLLFGINKNPSTTSFSDIQRLPAAHAATCRRDSFKVRRYWTLPIDEPIYFKRANDYTDRFMELLEVAVTDRLRTNKIGLFMSGGLDSPTLAATASKLLHQSSSNAEVQAFTTVIDGVDQNERHYAGLVAKHLRIPIHFRDRTFAMIDPDWANSAIRTPEPVYNPTTLFSDRKYYNFISHQTRVLFYGEGPDDALHYEWKPYLAYLSREKQFGRLAADVCRHAIRHRRVPLLPTIPRMLRSRNKSDRWRLSFPAWLNEHFESRLQLRNRWHEQNKPFGSISHKLRPIAHESFVRPGAWEMLFEALNSPMTGAPIEIRHPFLDLRLLRYMLAVPAIPWCRTKYLERRAARGLLPRAVLQRPKSPLKSDPLWEGARHLELPPLGGCISEYVDCKRVPNEVGSDLVRFRMNFRPFALQYWLQNIDKATRFGEDIHNESITSIAR